MNKWYESNGANSDVVLSSRIRLARNFSNYPFASKISDEDGTELVNSVAGTFQKDFPDEYRYYFMNSCTEAKKNALKERRSISSYLVKSKNGAVILSGDEGTSVLVNGEDHIRIQVIANGMNIPACFKKANEIDDYIDSRFDYAYDEQYGYKTTYPTNVGTGLRAGYTLHLPALSQTRKITQIGTELGRFGIRMRQVYGDEEDSFGNLYQVSTQKTLGQDERTIIKDFDDIVLQIISQEREQRSAIYDKDKCRAEDVAYKSYGVLKYARKLTLRDAMALLSELMTGLAIGILSTKDGHNIDVNRLIMDIQPAVLNNSAGKALSVAETDMLRAQYLRSNLPEID